MPTKATTKKTTIKLSGQEYDINNTLPTDMLQKDYQGIPYLEVSTYREITRQLSLIQEITYEPIVTIATGTVNKKGKQVKQMTLSQDCHLITKDGKKYNGNGIITASESALLNDSSSFGVISRLKARAFKDALKYEARIFELPSDKGEEQILDDFIEEGNKTEVVKKDTTPKEPKKEVDVVKEFDAILKKDKPKTKEAFQKLQVFFMNKYKPSNGFTQEQKDQLRDIKKDYLESIEA